MVRARFSAMVSCASRVWSASSTYIRTCFRQGGLISRTYIRKGGLICTYIREEGVYRTYIRKGGLIYIPCAEAAAGSSQNPARTIPHALPDEYQARSTDISNVYQGRGTDVYIYQGRGASIYTLGDRGSGLGGSWRFVRSERGRGMVRAMFWVMAS